MQQQVTVFALWPTLVFLPCDTHYRGHMSQAEGGQQLFLLRLAARPCPPPPPTAAIHRKDEGRIKT